MGTSVSTWSRVLWMTCIATSARPYPKGWCATLVRSSRAKSYAACLLPTRFRMSSVIFSPSAADVSTLSSELNPRKMFPSFVEGLPADVYHVRTGARHVTAWRLTQDAGM